MRAVLASSQPEIVINFIGFEPSEIRGDCELFERANLRQYIFISSTTVYSKPPRHLPIREDAPLGNQWWEYAQKKLECENLLMDQAKKGFPVTIVRPSHTYSKRWIPNPVSSSSYTFARRIEQGKAVFVPDQGENPWTLTAARDFAVGLAGLAGNPSAIGEAFHITSDEVLSWNQIYADISAALGIYQPQIIKIPTKVICEIEPSLTGTLKGDKAHPGIFDNTKIKRFVPDFECRVPFRVGVRESVEWLRSNPGNQNLNPQIDELIERVITAWQNRRP
jgi:nucleoside-diphosphate-sugar epimerase